MRTVVVDASAIINGFPMLMMETKYISSPSVIDEVKSKRGKKNLQTSIDFNIIDQRIPSFQAVLDVRKMAAETKDNLSKADEEVLALALVFDADIATDDYGIQNVAQKLGINILPVGERGIRKILHWQYYCPACKRKYEISGVCGVCGTKLKRKAKKTG